jgi:hypothetical protein
MVTQVLRRPGQVGIFDRLIVVFSTIAPVSARLIRRTKVCRAIILVGGQKWENVRSPVHRGTQPVLEFYDSKPL